MRNLFILGIAAAAAIGFTSCGNDNEETLTSTDSTSTSSMGEMNASTDAGGATASGSYVDLKTGKSVRRDETSGRYVDESGSPVDFWVDVNTRDTFYGSAGTNVNNALIYENGDWRVDDSKVKVDGDEVKMKDAAGKTKVDGTDYKDKTSDAKVKSEGDETKVKAR
jgi:hypothetical protein